MTTPEQLLERLEAVERGATGPPAGTGERVWGAIEARLVNGPAPPELDHAPLLDDALLDEALLDKTGLATNAGGSGSVVLKIIVALVLFAHGIGHVMGPLQVFRVATINPAWSGGSWIRWRGRGPIAIERSSAFMALLAEIGSTRRQATLSWPWREGMRP